MILWEHDLRGDRLDAAHLEIDAQCHIHRLQEGHVHFPAPQAADDIGGQQLDGMHLDAGEIASEMLQCRLVALHPPAAIVRDAQLARRSGRRRPHFPCSRSCGSQDVLGSVQENLPRSAE